MRPPAGLGYGCVIALLMWAVLAGAGVSGCEVARMVSDL
jgi:hypothetical protein